MDSFALPVVAGVWGLAFVLGAAANPVRATYPVGSGVAWADFVLARGAHCLCSARTNHVVVGSLVFVTTARAALALAVLIFRLDVRRPGPARWLLLARRIAVARIVGVGRSGAPVARGLPGGAAVDVVLARGARRLGLASAVARLCRGDRLEEAAAAFSAAPARGQQRMPVQKRNKSECMHSVRGSVGECVHSVRGSVGECVRSVRGSVNECE